MNEQWEKMQTALFDSGARAMWQRPGRKGDNMVECWIVGEITVLFVIYVQHGGFDVYTPNQAPREIDEILPWLLEQKS